MPRHLPLLLGILMFAVMIVSCYYDKGEELYPQLNTACDTVNVTFAKNIVPIFSSYCYGCHSNANAASFGNNIALENYGDVVSNLTKVYNSVTHQNGASPMPKNGGMLSDCAITQITIWKNKGTPQ